MRIMRKHNAKLEKVAGYDCIKCLGAKDRLVRVPGSYFGFDHLSPLSDVRAAHEVYNNIFENFAWPGGCPLVYVTDEGDVFCADCAKKFFIIEKEDITVDAYEEGPTLYCDECGKEITSAYGVPDEEDKE